METITYTCAETAKLIRRSLKAAFSGIKFSVRSQTYSGGSSINVNWTNGPVTESVEKVIFKYEACTFDGMQDLKEYRDIEGLNEKGEIVKINYGANYIFATRKITEEHYEKESKRIVEYYGVELTDSEKKDLNLTNEKIHKFTGGNCWTLRQWAAQNLHKVSL